MIGFTKDWSDLVLFILVHHQGTKVESAFLKVREPDPIARLSFFS